MFARKIHLSMRNRNIGDDEELYEKPKRSETNSSRDDSSVRVAWIGCLGVVLVALITLLGSIIVKTTDNKGTQQPVIIVILEFIRDRSVGVHSLTPNPTNMTQSDNLSTECTPPTGLIELAQQDSSK